MSDTEETISSLDPSDESVIEEIPITPPDEVRRIVRAANDASEPWWRRPLDERIELVEAAAYHLEQRTDELTELLTREQGKPLSESRGEVTNTVKRIRYFCERVEALVRADRIPVDDHVTGVVHHRPLGVVAGIKPWNFPVSIPIWTVVPALLTGNTVVCKPSELTPIIGRELLNCFPDELFDQDILSLVQGAGSTGRALVEADGVDHVAFVGSRETGESIYRESAQHLRTVSLELGGKDPMIVLDDAETSKVLDDIVYGAFKNCGQVCCGIERMLIPQDRADEFIEPIVERVRNLTVGRGVDDDTDVGPMIRQEEADRVQRHLEDAESKGAEVIRSDRTPDRDSGFWQAPAVVLNATRDMTVMNEETFGPVLAITTYRDEAEAIREANRLEFGLSAAIYGEDSDRLRSVAERVEAGSIGINQTVGSIVELPWGGVKKSGIGRMLNDEGVLKFTESVTERWHPDELDRLS